MPNCPRKSLVFPAGAGVFPTPAKKWTARASVPRRCGGVPGAHVCCDQALECSPQVRGCSLSHVVLAMCRIVFPAGAGVFPQSFGIVANTGCVPRRCGGVPMDLSFLAQQLLCSPQVRGCSLVPGTGIPFGEVFPAGAGVFPISSCQQPFAQGVPRRCGGVPVWVIIFAPHYMCSPQVRGCS